MDGRGEWGKTRSVGVDRNWEWMEEWLGEDLGEGEWLMTGEELGVGEWLEEGSGEGGVERNCVGVRICTCNCNVGRL